MKVGTVDADLPVPLRRAHDERRLTTNADIIRYAVEHRLRL